jgi:hypothetical protein
MNQSQAVVSNRRLLTIIYKRSGINLTLLLRGYENTETLGKISSSSISRVRIEVGVADDAERR